MCHYVGTTAKSVKHLNRNVELLNFVPFFLERYSNILLFLEKI